MSIAAMANSNYQKTIRTWSSILEDLFPSLATSLINFPLCLFYAFAPSALSEVWRGLAQSNSRCQKHWDAAKVFPGSTVTHRLGHPLCQAHLGSPAQEMRGALPPLSLQPLWMVHLPVPHILHTHVNSSKSRHFQTLDHQNMSKKTTFIDVIQVMACSSPKMF